MSRREEEYKFWCLSTLCCQGSHHQQYYLNLHHQYDCWNYSFSKLPTLTRKKTGSSRPLPSQWQKHVVLIKLVLTGANRDEMLQMPMRAFSWDIYFQYHNNCFFINSKNDHQQQNYYLVLLLSTTQSFYSSDISMICQNDSFLTPGWHSTMVIGLTKDTGLLVPLKIKLKWQGRKQNTHQK